MVRLSDNRLCSSEITITSSYIIRTVDKVEQLEQFHCLSLNISSCWQCQNEFLSCTATRGHSMRISVYSCTRLLIINLGIPCYITTCPHNDRTNVSNTFIARHACADERTWLPSGLVFCAIIIYHSTRVGILQHRSLSLLYVSYRQYSRQPLFVM